MTLYPFHPSIRGIRGRLAVRGHADLLAHVQDRASGAAGQAAGADVLAKGDEEAVDVQPVAAREPFLQSPHGSLGASRRDIPPAVRHAVYVNVNADERLTAGDAEDEVGALGAHARERTQHGLVAGDRAVQAREESRIIKNDARVEASELKLKAAHEALQVLTGVEDELSAAFNNIRRRRKELDEEAK